MAKSDQSTGQRTRRAAERSGQSVLARWAPAVAMALAGAGMALIVAGDEAVGVMLATCGLIISGVLLVASPFRHPTKALPLDERELEWQRQSSELGHRAVSSLTLIGTAAIGLSNMLGGWTPTTDADWLGIMLVLIVMTNTLPAMHWTWTRPREIEEA